MSEKQKCCYDGCDEDADFSVYHTCGHPGCVTDACEDHVGRLIGCISGSPSAERQPWRVYPL